jgi:hypothetical protein
MNFTPQSDVEFTVEKWASVFAENNPDTYRGTVFQGRGVVGHAFTHGTIGSG